MRINPDKFRAFNGAAMANFYNFLGAKIKAKMRTSTKSVEPKKKKKFKKMKKLRKLRRSKKVKIKIKKLKLKKIQQR